MTISSSLPPTGNVADLLILREVDDDRGGIGASDSIRWTSAVANDYIEPPHVEEEKRDVEDQILEHVENKPEEGT